MHLRECRSKHELGIAEACLDFPKAFSDLVGLYSNF
jgi:hypothetical protein